MARSLAYRDVAKNYTKQATALDREAVLLNNAAKQMEQSNQASIEQLKLALAAYDAALRCYFQAGSMEEQAAQYNLLADAAWDNGNGDPREAP